MLSMQTEVPTETGTELVNTFIRNPNYNEAKGPIRKYLKGVTADKFERVQVNPKIYENTKPNFREDIYNTLVNDLKAANFSDKDIAKITKKDFNPDLFGKVYSDIKPAADTTLRDPSNFMPFESNDLQKVFSQSNPEKVNVSLSKSGGQLQVPNPTEGMNMPIPGEYELPTNTLYDLNEKLTFAEDMANIDAGPMYANLHGETYIDGIPSSMLYNENQGLSAQILKEATTESTLRAGAPNTAEAIKNISKGQKIAQGVGKGMQVAGQLAGAYRAGKALSDGYQHEDIPEIAKGAVAMASPWLVAAGPAGWAVIGAAALHDLYELF
tara:strand:- start:173 stop:1147 length:975 start_codon:yes stop_codon:yes gene_type:complete